MEMQKSFHNTCTNCIVYCMLWYLKAMCASFTISGIWFCLIFSSIMSSFPFVHLQDKRLKFKKLNANLSAIGASSTI